MTAATPTAGPQVDPILEPKVARPNLDHPTEPKTVWALLAIGVAGLLYAAYSIHADLGPNAHAAKLWPFILLGVALLIALGFEFVNGFHDTANAVATVIYTHSLAAPTAVAWSGLWNFLGVLTSSGLVAFGIRAAAPEPSAPSLDPAHQRTIFWGVPSSSATASLRQKWDITGMFHHRIPINCGGFHRVRRHLMKAHAKI